MAASEASFAAVPVNAETLKRDYLVGLELTDQDGVPFSDQLFDTAVKTSIARLQREIDVCIVPTEFTENHDYVIDEYKNWSYIPVDHVPILSVKSVKAVFPFGTTAVEFPQEWIVVSPLRHVQIVPRSGSLATVFLGAGQILLPLLHGATGYVPDLMEVVYTSGFAADSIPADVLHVISLYASINVLNPAGDLIIGPGISNEELMLNAMRQRIETTASPTNSGFGARILQYRKELGELIPLLRKYYQGLRMAVM